MYSEGRAFSHCMPRTLWIINRNGHCKAESTLFVLLCAFGIVLKYVFLLYVM